MKLSKVLSERVKALREAAGLSQQEVAVKSDLSMSLVAKIEQGKKADPRLSTIWGLAHALNTTPGGLLDDLFAATTAEVPKTDDLPHDAPTEPEIAPEVNGEANPKKKGKAKKKKKK